ncbi:MAG TPA: gamma-glutamylcyclotransferase [Caulobacteraceae bacterium]
MGEREPEEPWVFGYGSLMWRPGFGFVERRPAWLHGRRRAFCIFSVHHRGTPARPGLVLGLAPGGSVRGAAYRIDPREWPAVQAYLSEREQPTETYVEAVVQARLADGQVIAAVAFLSDCRHPQWAGKLSLEAQARLIAGASGLSGPNVDYLRDLVEHLSDEGIRDPSMERLLELVQTRHKD